MTITSIAPPPPDSIYLPLSSQRIRWYNPKLDPYVIVNKMTPAMAKAVESYDDGSEELSGPLNVPNESHPYNLVSSLCADGLHRPVLDIDLWPKTAVRHQVEAELVRRLGWDHNGFILVPSTSHWHAYFPWVAYNHQRYFGWLEKVCELGIIEPGYLAASIVRGQTLIRPPHIRKLRDNDY